MASQYTFIKIKNFQGVFTININGTIYFRPKYRSTAKQLRAKHLKYISSEILKIREKIMRASNVHQNSCTLN